MGEVINFKWCQLRGCIFGLSLGEWVTPIMGDTRENFLPTKCCGWWLACISFGAHKRPVGKVLLLVPFYSE